MFTDKYHDSLWTVLKYTLDVEDACVQSVTLNCHRKGSSKLFRRNTTVPGVTRVAALGTPNHYLINDRDVLRVTDVSHSLLSDVSWLLSHSKLSRDDLITDLRAILPHIAYRIANGLITRHGRLVTIDDPRFQLYRPYGKSPTYQIYHHHMLLAEVLIPSDQTDPEAVHTILASNLIH